MLGVSGLLPTDDSIISIPWRRVIISRKKQATADAAEPFSFEKSKRLLVASPATCAACAIGSDVLAAKTSWKMSSQLPHLPRRGFQPSWLSLTVRHFSSVNSAQSSNKRVKTANCLRTRSPSSEQPQENPYRPL